jgi:hypothetical protein
MAASPVPRKNSTLSHGSRPSDDQFYTRGDVGLLTRATQGSGTHVVIGSFVSKRGWAGMLNALGTSALVWNERIPN